MSSSEGCSGGVVDLVGHIGDLPAYAEMPNSLTNLYDANDNLIQQREYGADGKASKNIDWSHGNKGGVHKFPHIYKWNWSNKTLRGKALGSNRQEDINE